MTQVAQVPDTLDELLTPEWLSVALSSRFPGVQVRAVTRGPVVERLSTNARFFIECAPPAPEGLVPNLCVKGYFSEQGRSMRSVGEPEASFYRDLAGPTGVRTLRSVWADVHPETRHGVVITEDVIAQGGEFRDALSPCSDAVFASCRISSRSLSDRSPREMYTHRSGKTLAAGNARAATSNGTNTVSLRMATMILLLHTHRRGRAFDASLNRSSVFAASS